MQGTTPPPSTPFFRKEMHLLSSKVRRKYSITKLSLDNLYVTTETLGTILTALPRVTDLNIEFLKHIDDYNSHISLHLNCQEL